MSENPMIGRRYTRLTVIAETGERKAGHPLYLCRCMCGAEKKIVGRELRRGSVRSCGCLHRDIIRARGLLRYRSSDAFDAIDEDILR